MIKALMPVLQDFAVFSPSTHNGHSGDALANTLVPGSIIRSMDSSEDESVSSTDDIDGETSEREQTE